MELSVKFVDYSNEISVSKVNPRCGRSVASAQHGSDNFQYSINPFFDRV